MITLKTLAQATEQEVFDQVAVHLLTQNKKSVSPEKPSYCKYRGGEDGSLKCAAGCLIGDDEYHIGFEQNRWYNLVNTWAISENHMAIITNLQKIHDNKEPEIWKEELLLIAERHALNTDKIFNI
jgi:hypothetical protein